MVAGVDVGVVQVDSTGYRVVGGVGVRDEGLLARGVVELARGLVAVSRALGVPARSVQVNLDGAVIVVGVRRDGVVGVVLEDHGEGAPAGRGLARGVATG